MYDEDNIRCIIESGSLTPYEVINIALAYIRNSSGRPSREDTIKLLDMIDVL
jgi:hypothetical protein